MSSRAQEAKRARRAKRSRKPKNAVAPTMTPDEFDRGQALSRLRSDYDEGLLSYEEFMSGVSRWFPTEKAS